MTAAVGMPAQMKGYLFEVVVRRFLATNGWRLLSEPEPGRVLIHDNFKIEIRGRGINHQIDSPCVSDHAIPFIFPLRLIVEAKFYDHEVRKDHVRPFVGLMKDISENYVVSADPTVRTSKRYTDVGAFFSASGFHREAINLAHAHGIVTVSYRNNPLLSSVKNSILRLSDVGFPDRGSVKREGGLFVFMNDLDRYLIQDHGADSFITQYGGNEECRAIAGELREHLAELDATFIGTTNSGVLLHFVGRGAFPDELFVRTDTQLCRVFFSAQDSMRQEVNMWLEFTEDRSTPKRKFYFDVPPGLEDAIRRGQGVIDAKREALAEVVVSRRISDLSRTLVLKLDGEWLNRLEGMERRVG